jgi:hypothetical protein
MQNSIYDNFVILATLPAPMTPGYHNLPGMDQPDLVLIILEMWCCLLLRSLPRQTLETYLPPTSPIQTEQSALALNIATPLDNGDKTAREYVNLSSAQDPLVQEYVRSREIKSIPHIPAPAKRKKADRAVAHNQTQVSLGPTLFFGTLVFVGFFLLTKSPARPRYR